MPTPSCSTSPPASLPPGPPCPVPALVEALHARWHTAERPTGFLHADLHFGNVRFEGRTVHPIDFDDCGPAPLLYDLCVVGGTVHDKPGLVDRLAAAYNADADTPVTVADIELFIAIRQIAMMGWVLDRAEIFTPQRQRDILGRLLGRARMAMERIGLG